MLKKGALLSSAPFCCYQCDSLLYVIPGDSTAVVHPESRADHTKYECGRESELRAEEPAGVAADRRANEGEELSHTTWTIAGRDRYALRHGIYGPSEYTLAPTHAETRKLTSPKSAKANHSPIDIIPMCRYPDRKIPARIQNRTAA